MLISQNSPNQKSSNYEIVIPKAYSLDLQWRIIWCYLAYHSLPVQLADVFSRSERTVRRYIVKFYKTGDVEPKEGGHGL